jgi:hypothetical protein
MYLFMLYLAVHLTCDTAETPVNWDNTKGWKIYSLNDPAKVFTISTDSIQTLRGIFMSDDSIHNLLDGARVLHIPTSPAWMGCYLASCENENGHLMKIVVSQYGGFFLDAYDSTYYELDPRSTRAWLDYMRRSYIKAE